MALIAALNSPLIEVVRFLLPDAVALTASVLPVSFELVTSIFLAPARAFLFGLRFLAFARLLQRFDNQPVLLVAVSLNLLRRAGLQGFFVAFCLRPVMLLLRCESRFAAAEEVEHSAEQLLNRLRQSGQAMCCRAGSGTKPGVNAFP